MIGGFSKPQCPQSSPIFCLLQTHTSFSCKDVLVVCEPTRMVCNGGVALLNHRYWGPGGGGGGLQLQAGDAG